MAVAARLPFVLARHSPPDQPDTIVYFAVADHLRAGELFFQDVLTRGPGYSYFVVLVDALPLGREPAIALVQHLLGVALIVAVVRFAWRRFGAWTASLTGLLMATSPLLFVIEDDALPDFLFGALVLAFVIALTLLVERRPAAWWSMAPVGALIGAAALVKPVGQLLVVAAAIVLVLAGWRGRALARDVALVVVGCLIVLGPWLVHGLVRYGSPTLSAQGSLTLFNRVYEVDHRPLPQDTRDGRIVADAVRRQPDQRPHAIAFTTLERDRDDNRAALSALRTLALEGIADYPAEYALDTLTGVRRFSTDLKADADDGDPYEPRAGPLGASVPRFLWRLGAIASQVWWIVTLFGLTGIATVLVGPRERRLVAMVLLTTWLVLALATVASHGGLPRYSMQLAPITWMLSWAGLTGLVAAAWGRFRPSSGRLSDVAGSPQGAR